VLSIFHENGLPIEFGDRVKELPLRFKLVDGSLGGSESLLPAPRAASQPTAVPKDKAAANRKDCANDDEFHLF
jgi:hypothetical protein